MTRDRPITTLIDQGIKGHQLVLGPCMHEWCDLLHYYCTCCEWQGSTILTAEYNKREFAEHLLDIKTNDRGTAI